MVALLCEHCLHSVKPSHCITHAGNSYHHGCYKCCLCGETDLQDCEVFQGVLICMPCARDVFYGRAGIPQGDARSKRNAANVRHRPTIRPRTPVNYPVHRKCGPRRTSDVTSSSAPPHTTDNDSDTDSTECETVVIRRKHNARPDDGTLHLELHVIKAPVPLCAHKSSQIDSNSFEMTNAARLILQLMEKINSSISFWGKNKESYEKQRSEATEEVVEKRTSSEINKKIIEMGTLSNLLQQVLETINKSPVELGMMNELGEIEQSSYDYDRGEVKRETILQTKNMSDDMGTVVNRCYPRYLSAFERGVIKETKWDKNSYNDSGRGEEKQKSSDIKKENLEKGTMTFIDQKQLMELFTFLRNSNVIISQELFKISNQVCDKGESNRMTDRKKCSDMRIAELGTSTEIAHCGLRKRSDAPVKVMSRMTLDQHSCVYLLSEINVGDRCKDCTHKARSKDVVVAPEKSQFWRRFTNTELGFLLAVPFIYFKNRILRRSSLISLIMSLDEKSKHSIMKQMRKLFHDDINDRRRRGLKKLHSTIRRRRSPHEIGYHKCKRLMDSYSYQCLRSHVMRRAGPTKSELNSFWLKTSNLFTPEFYKRIFNMDRRVQLSAACGRTETPSTPLTRKNTDLPFTENPQCELIPSFKPHFSFPSSEIKL